MSIIKRLANRVLTPSGKPRRGAISRAAEHLQVSRSTIYYWILGHPTQGKWSPGKATLARIEDMLRDGVDLSARKPGPKNK